MASNLAYGPQIVTEKLWMLIDPKDGNQGATIRNLAKNNSGADRTLQANINVYGTPTVIDDNYWLMDGAGDYFLTDAFTAIDWNNHDFSFCVWANPDDNTNNQCHVLDLMYVGNGHFRLRLVEIPVLLYRATGGSSIVLVNDNDSASQISTGSWSHVVVTGKTDQYFMYLNGKLVGQDTDTALTADGNMTRVTIGNSADDDNLSGTGFDGKLGPVSIYKDKALTHAEVKQNFNAQRSRFGI